MQTIRKVFGLPFIVIGGVFIVIGAWIRCGLEGGTVKLNTMTQALRQLNNTNAK